MNTYTDEYGYRIAKLHHFYPDASDETLRRFCELRDEGYNRYQAALQSGLEDPSE